LGKHKLVASMAEEAEAEAEAEEEEVISLRPGALRPEVAGVRLFNRCRGEALVAIG
jgi:hypothetical protein